MPVSGNVGGVEGDFSGVCWLSARLFSKSGPKFQISHQAVQIIRMNAEKFRCVSYIASGLFHCIQNQFLFQISDGVVIIVGFVGA